MPVPAKACPALAMIGCRPTGDRRTAVSERPVMAIFVSGISPPGALTDALSAFPHVLEKINMRQDLKWYAEVFDVLRCSRN
ncbi:hypothetical protein BQ8794_110201 [Mesorhizobium prunaredense]|uniref:Uncharacterized protein n=1 Tax=Mesorhizobium prunaredense TaxID=1631249 RepID=A0A1R3V0H9_9HYPH|nr:hypothetical protein [Mesorhizobium prunaredense]SIT53395.1 hypothetical protein BQ8794_110201 [Mesorhizobium prunaredense]